MTTNRPGMRARRTAAWAASALLPILLSGCKITNDMSGWEKAGAFAVDVLALTLLAGFVIGLFALNAYASR